MTQIRAFSDRYAALGVHRFAIKLNKSNQYDYLLKKMRNEFFDMTEMRILGTAKELKEHFT